MPVASPLVMVKPAPARKAAKSCAVSRPVGEGLREPTMATWGESSSAGSPLTNRIGGASPSSASSGG